jgi:hypothetical protein
VSLMWRCSEGCPERALRSWSKTGELQEAPTWSRRRTAALRVKVDETLLPPQFTEQGA